MKTELKAVENNLYLVSDFSLASSANNIKDRLTKNKISFINVVGLDTKDSILFDGNIADLSYKLTSLTPKPVVFIEEVKLASVSEDIRKNLKFGIGDLQEGFVAQLTFKFKLGDFYVYATYQTNWLKHAILGAI